MKKSRKPSDLEEILNQIGNAEDEGGEVSLESVLKGLGRRSFGPLLILAGLVILAPVIGDIPGVPTLVAFFVILVAGQMLFNRHHFWLPDWLLRRKVKKGKLDKAVKWLRIPAGYLDRFLRNRLGIFTGALAVRLIAFFCILIAVLTPFLELVPFSANLAGGAMIVFGAALVAEDGFLALLAFILAATTLGVAVYNIW
ncbi:MAG: exopolysaccharide biosynthesis protein [Desulfurivibrionaceae bacterium]